MEQNVREVKEMYQPQQSWGMEQIARQVSDAPGEIGRSIVSCDKHECFGSKPSSIERVEDATHLTPVKERRWGGGDDEWDGTNNDAMRT
jgi:hypothetical protein